MDTMITAKETAALAALNAAAVAHGALLRELGYTGRAPMPALSAADDARLTAAFDALRAAERAYERAVRSGDKARRAAAVR